MAGACPIRDDGFAALQLSLRPSASRRSCVAFLPPTDTRARVYTRDGTLIIDSNELLGAAEPCVDRARTSRAVSRVKTLWTRSCATG